MWHWKHVVMMVIGNITLVLAKLFSAVGTAMYDTSAFFLEVGLYTLHKLFPEEE